jgi:taurine dioxygenase
MTIRVEPSGQNIGASVHGADFSKPIDDDTAAAIRAAWLEHQVIGFPDQRLELDHLEAIPPRFGRFGEDPYIAPLPGRRHVIAVRREADEKSPIFAESWHSDWSFLPDPPSGTALYGMEIPPVGGDTLFADQYGAYEALPAAMRARLDGLVAIHSARRGYALQGRYGGDDARDRSMTIRPSDDALATHRHPLVRVHPETGRKALFISQAYTIGIDGMPADEADALLAELFAHQVEDRFVYRHRWSAGLLTMWDNRCVLHRATGGYEGHRRLLYRVTIAEPTTQPQAQPA